jgi:hypothetical protein
MSTYVVRIRNSRMGDGPRRSETITPELIRGLVRTSGAELTYMQNPSQEYPLTLVCHDLDNRAVSRFLDALGMFDGVRTEVARLF